MVVVYLIEGDRHVHGVHYLRLEACDEVFPCDDGHRQNGGGRVREYHLACGEKKKEGETGYEGARVFEGAAASMAGMPDPSDLSVGQARSLPPLTPGHLRPYRPNSHRN
jgi:hypothetical protein